MLLNEPLLETIRDFLQTELEGVKLPTRSIRITNEERVMASSGEEFINIYGAESNNEYSPIAETRKEVYSLKIGITRRLIGIPLDTTAESIYTYDEALIKRTKSSMSNRASEIINLLDGSWAIVSLIKQKYGICAATPLGFLGSAALEEKGAEHFEAMPENENPIGLFLELSFGGLQAYTNKYPITS